MFTTLISAKELHDAQSSNADWVVIDCRFSLMNTSQGEEHYSESRIPGARYAHLDNHLSSPIIPGVTGRHPLPDAAKLARQFAQWGINNNTQIVAYDDKPGAIASRFWWLSRWLGHEACAVLDGGLVAWKANDYALEETTPAAIEPGNFKQGESLMQVVEKQDVLNDEFCLLDAREAERYRGEKEPIDPVAGHIPGALNAPFAENLEKDGRFKSKEALLQRFSKTAELDNNRTLVHYCGSGVTAAHNMLAMVHAGLEPGAMYAGSFSEWVSQQDDEQFPVVRQGD